MFCAEIYIHLDLADFDLILDTVHILFLALGPRLHNFGFGNKVTFVAFFLGICFTQSRQDSAIYLQESDSQCAFRTT